MYLSVAIIIIFDANIVKNLKFRNNRHLFFKYRTTTRNYSKIGDIIHCAVVAM